MELKTHYRHPSMLMRMNIYVYKQIDIIHFYDFSHDYRLIKLQDVAYHVIGIILFCIKIFANVTNQSLQ